MVRRIYYKDDSSEVLSILSPPSLILSKGTTTSLGEIHEIEDSFDPFVHALELDGLDVLRDGGRACDVQMKLEAVEDRALPST